MKKYSWLFIIILIATHKKWEKNGERKEWEDLEGKEDKTERSDRLYALNHYNISQSALLAIALPPISPTFNHSDHSELNCQQVKIHHDSGCDVVISS